MLYIKLFIEREKNIGQSAPECPFKARFLYTVLCFQIWFNLYIIAMVSIFMQVMFGSKFLMLF